MLDENIQADLYNFAENFGIWRLTLFGPAARREGTAQDGISLAVEGCDNFSLFKEALLDDSCFWEYADEMHLVDLDGPVPEPLRAEIECNGVVIYDCRADVKPREALFDMWKQEVAQSGVFDKLAKYFWSQKACYGSGYRVNLRCWRTGEVVRALDEKLDAARLEDAIEGGANQYVEGYAWTDAGLVRDVVYSTRNTPPTLLRESCGLCCALDEQALDTYIAGLEVYGRECVERSLASEARRRGWGSLADNR